MPVADRYDLIVLGAGSGGLAAALRAAQHGARVLVLDPGPVGGTCVHAGCVPKKATWYAAQLAQLPALARGYGFAMADAPLDWSRFLARRQAYVEASRDSYMRQLAAAGVTLRPSPGRLHAPGEVEDGEGHRWRAPHVLLATGSRPRQLDVPGFALGLCSQDMFRQPHPPARLAIIGAGYIAVEFAGLMQALGSQVQLFARGRLLQSFDGELVHALQQSLLDQGVGIAQPVTVSGLQRSGEGLQPLDREGRPLGGFDAVLWAVGRVPNSQGLGLEALGVAMDRHGHVLSDERLATNVPGLYALGDVSSHRALTPVAVRAGRVLAERLFGGQHQLHFSDALAPSVLFAEPPLASVGLSEEAARRRHDPARLKIYRSRFRPMLWALAGREQTMLMKAICLGEQEQVIGLHLHGPGADEILQGFALAMQLGLRREELQAAIAVHPSLGEELLRVD